MKNKLVFGYAIILNHFRIFVQMIILFYLYIRTRAFVGRMFIDFIENMAFWSAL